MDEKDKLILEAIEKKFADLQANATKETETKFNELETSLNAIKEDASKNIEVSKEEIAKIVKGFDTLSEEVQKLAENSKSKVAPAGQFREALKAACEQLIESKKQGNSTGFIAVKTPVQTKTVGTMSFTSSVTGQIPQAEREPGMTNLVRQAFSIRNGSNVYPISSNLAEWVEQQNIEGSAGMTAEGATKTQMDWEWIVKNAAVKKITDYVKITEEMLMDVDGIMGEINGNLAYQIELKEEAQLIAGVGTTVYLNGIDVYAQALDLAALSGTVEAANNWDAIGAAITQIRVNGKGEFVANRVFMNPVDIFLSIHGTKDTTNDYINPVTVVPNVTPGGLPSIFIWGVPVVPNDTVAAGTFYVCDMTKFTIRDKEALRIEIGLDSDDFTKNLVTIRGEKRLVSYAKTAHVEAFVKSTFATAKAYLETAS